MLKKIITAIIIISMFVSGINFSYNANSMNVSAVSEGDEEMLSEYAQRVLEITNAERVKEGLSPLNSDDDLNELSEMRADELTETYSHERPDGTMCNTILAEFGISTQNYGENIAYTSLGYSDQPATVADSWINSEGHRENILNESYTNIGIGVAYLDGYYYWVQTFTSDIKKVSTEIVWNISDDGILEISGIGDMENYNENHAPWYSEKDRIKEVIINNGIKSIGDYAFADCEYIASVKFPETLSKIGTGAFENCSSLDNINFPSKLNEIGDYSFRNCKALSDVEIPENINKIGLSAFSGCDSLESITIMNSDSEINDTEETIINTAIIHGYRNSTAQAYAEKYGNKFIAIDFVYGDSNQDGEITIADAVLIMQALSNSDEYSFTETGSLSADVLDNDGVSSKDALVVQMVVANTISADDLPLTSEFLETNITL